MSVDLSRLKAYAPQARKDFRKSVTERAARIGITAGGIVEAQRQGDVVIVGGTAYDKTFGKQREALVSKVKKDGFDQVIEEIAYTWFNRLIALRFLELNEYLGHGFQIVGPGKTSGTLPEALLNAEHLNLPRLPEDRVREIKIAGDYEEKLYRSILIAQCNALSDTMGFMFEKIGDATELLLPDNLLATDGIIRKLVMNSDAKSWRDVEIIGWLYQFYIAEKKDDVFRALKKKVKISAANIPAATQLFTPHWIVKYLVENSLGRLWLQNNPSSKLADKMDYYIAPKESEADFLRIGSPEEIKICDPACGSGHMLIYAFDLLYSIYEEAGYRARDIPSCILDKNLQGIEIDDRAGALAAFSLAMKARAQDGRFFTRSVKPRIFVLEDVVFTEAEMQDVTAVVGKDLFTDELRETLGQFQQAKNFGSLIVPKLRDPAETLRVVEARIAKGADLMLKPVLDRAATALRMAEALSSKYHVVVANPPYMGRGSMNTALMNWTESNYQLSKTDLFAMFMSRSVTMNTPKGFMAMINMQSWMFLSSFEKLRSWILGEAHLVSMAHFGERAFDTIGGAVVSTTAFVLEKTRNTNKPGCFVRLIEGRNEFNKRQCLLRAAQDRKSSVFWATTDDFERIPGAPIAYWISQTIADAFLEEKLKSVGNTRRGLQTGGKEKFIRQWPEVTRRKTDWNSRCREDALVSAAKWFRFNNGGDFRKWAGGMDLVVNWLSDGQDIKSSGKAIIPSEELYFREAVCWGRISSGPEAYRLHSGGIIPGDLSPCYYSDHLYFSLAYFNSPVARAFKNVVNPTITNTVGDLAKIPSPYRAMHRRAEIEGRARTLVARHQSDWDAYETSWDFASLPLLSSDIRGQTLEDSYLRLRDYWQGVTKDMQRLEEDNNRIFIDAYCLQDELMSEVPLSEITLTSNPAYRYSMKGTEDERREFQQRDTMCELVSYAVGCMMGRYSLVQPGLIYADEGNIGFDGARYGDFPADDDGIIPITNVEWFSNDATARFIEFLRQTFGEDKLGENLEFLANSIEPKRKISAPDTIRKYFSRSFFKDHLKTYKSRPIYWLFSSGKERALECLVYLHRYDENTLGRMRAEYVIPLQTKMQNRIQTIEGEILRGDLSSALLKARTKELAGLETKKTELDRFEANLRHMAEERISLDLDDGVKVNYGKFGDLLAETNTVCGSKDEG
ncbi:BREX-1 system adenine-specific DNA-methyltransferase PglX [Aurantimonas sp. A2-1-M11]|uniref:BREX-1 system adenine-specific DNA-methyltransferase PglX n=1 Tax=Aurantimonas sp. A2-1-M11 TaxID=3113712 RepID=UPI002F92893F